MPRDYKRPSKRQAKRERATVLRSLLMGFAAGGLVAGVAVYLLLGEREIGVPERPQAATVAEPASAREPAPTRRPAPAPAQEDRFGFYTLLPEFEVEVPVREEEEPTSAAPKRVEKAGKYVLQAGSFRRYEDADRMQATLALQGIVARVQTVVIRDDETWHRVRVGPMTDLSELHRLRTRLREADIDAVLLSLGD